MTDAAIDRPAAARDTSGAMQAPPASTLVLIALLPLIAWRMYSRFRRLVGRQRLSRIRPWITLTLFPLIVVLLAFAAWSHAEREATLVAGLAGGALLGVYGLRKTRFEPTPQGLFYTPNAHIGIALSLLFAGRIAWRLFEVYAAGPQQQPPDFARSPLTLVVFGLLAGYYVAYAIGLVRWRGRVMRAKQALEQHP